MQDCKNGSGIQFNKFYFVTGGPDINTAIRVELCFFFFC